MKKKSLTKRLVSFVTAVGLTLTSTVMLIPASAAVYEDCAACIEAGADPAGTMEWQSVEEGAKHQIVCTENPDHTEGDAHVAGMGMDLECPICMETQYTVSVASVDFGLITASFNDETLAEGEESVAMNGTEIGLSALPDEGYDFTNWVINGENGATDATTTVAVNGEDVTISAVFTKNQSEPVVDTYTVTIAESENGTVVADKETAAEGDTVTLTVTPAAENYEIAEVSYTTEGGDKEVLEAVDGVYTFKMPAANVTVSATFNDVTPKPTSYTVTVNDVTGGTITATPAETAEEGKVAEGTKVVLGVELTSGYAFNNEYTVADANGSAVTVSSEKDASNNDVYYFLMPASDVTVTAKYYEAMNCDWTKVEDGVYTLETTREKYTGDTINALDIELAEGKTFADVKSIKVDFEVSEGNWAGGGLGANGAAAASWEQVGWSTSDGETCGTVTLAPADGFGTAEDAKAEFQIWWIGAGTITATITVEYNTTEEPEEPAVSSSITIDTVNGITITATPAEADEDDKVAAGTKVTLGYTLTENAGYAFNNEYTVTDAEGNIVELDVEAASEDNGWKAVYSFTMPASDVTVSAKTYEAVKTDWVDNENGTYTVTPERLYDGDGVNDLKIELDEGKTYKDLVSITVNYKLGDGNYSAGGALGSNDSTGTWTSVSWDNGATSIKLQPENGFGASDILFQTYWTGGALTVTSVEIEYVKTYKITVDDDIANGSIEIANLPTEAVEGELIRFEDVTATPAEGYRFDDVFCTYVDADGETVEFGISRGSEAIYYFDMPAADVVITATFVKETYFVDVTKKGSGSASAWVNGVETDRAQMGDKVKLEAEPTVGYEFVEWRVIEGDVKIETVESEYPGFAPGDTYFIMPAENVEIEAFFKVADSYVIRVNEDVKGEVTVAETAMAEEEVTFTVEAAEGYKVDQVTYSYDKPAGGVFGDTIEADEDGNYTFTMPAADVTINVAYTAIDYDVRVVTADNGTVTTDLEVDEETGVATANVYDLVTITVTPDEGYQLVKDSLVVTDEMDTPVEITANEDGTYSFEMPASDVTIEAEFEAIDYTITVEKTGEGEVEVVETANIKDVVTITATPDGENVVKSIKVTYAKGEETVEVKTTKGEDGTYTFEMPAANVTVTVVFDMFVFELAAPGTPTIYADTWEEIAELIEDGMYMIRVNKDYEFGTKFALPKTAKILRFNGDGKLTFTGTKLAIPVDTEFHNEIAVSNKTGLIDITVAKDKYLTLMHTPEEDEEPVQFINKITGTKTSSFAYEDYRGITVNNIATFGAVSGNITVNGGKATGIAMFEGYLTIKGAKATAAITDIAGGSSIYLIEENGVLPKVTIDNVVAGTLPIADDETETTTKIGVFVLDAEEEPVELVSGTTVLYSKNDIDDNVEIFNNTAYGDKLTAYYYAKTKEIKAEYGEALTLTYGEGDTAFEKNYPNFDLLFADITDNTVAYTIEVGTDLTLGTKFALPKKAGSITFDGEGILTFTGTKLAVPYNVTISEGITIKVSNKKNAFDISVAKDATLTTEGEIEGINKLSGTKTSTLVGDYAVKNLATFKLVDGYITVDGGKVTGVITLNGGLRIGGAKATAAITTITPDSQILLVKVNNVLPKVTIEGVGEAVEDVENITVTVLDSFVVEDVAELESGTVILYTKKADYTGKIEIGNDSDMKAYLYGKEIKAEFAEAVTVDNLDTTGDDENADLEKDYQNLEAAVAAINAANDNTANYEITINKDIAPVKFDLPKAAASVILVGDNVTINVGKATSITANTDLAINGIEFVTTGKTLTINAKKNLAVNELYGNVTAIKGGAKSTLTWVSENEATALVDITGFGTVEVRETLTIGKNFNVTKLVLGAEDSATALIVSNVAAKASIKALDATNGGAIEYAEGAKIALAFTGKDADFVVAEDGLTIIGAVANGQAVLATDKVAITKLANGVTPANPAVEYGFVKVGKNICYMGKVLEVTAVKGEEPVGDEVAYALWSEVIAAMSDAEADYVITLLDDYNADGAIKLPKAGTYKSVTIKSEEGEYHNFNFTGNLTFTAATVISNVNIGALKKGAPAKYTINAGKNDITITDCDTGMLTSVKGANVNLSTVSVGKVTADALNLGEFVVAKDGVTTKALSIAGTGAKLSINQGKKLVVNGDVTIAETETAKGLEIAVLDKVTGEAATLKNGEVIATVKGEGYANITLDQTAHEGVSLE